MWTQWIGLIFYLLAACGTVELSQSPAAAAVSAWSSQAPERQRLFFKKIITFEQLNSISV